jgi:serine/threonine-protein kinase PknG
MNCMRPGCAGTIDPDGYCDTCGHKAGEAPGRPAASIAGEAPGTAAEAPGRPATSSAPSGTVPVSPGPRAGGTRSSGRPSGRGNLGAGLVEVHPVEYRDPASALMPDPQLPESKRYCRRCDAPVGRGRDGRPGRAEGFCPQCGAQYSFTPKLDPGELVAGQYEVAGCLAHGGLGWVYLARDRNVENRWVVLKGLLDTGDESAMAAAIVERRFLAEVEHPNIVRIYNFVQHRGNGYIVMEYVGGSSLKELRRDGSGAPAAMPAAQAIAYLLEVLPALDYLHRRGLLYCDFKPDNVIQTEEQVKVIDLGGVRRIGDDSSDLYGTVGYQAPEVPGQGPSIASDLYTVARTLAVLVFDFRGFQDPRRYRDTLPPVSEVGVFARYPALHRFLVKSTHPNPSRRFQSAADMAEQLLGVLRQVIAGDGGEPEPAPSRIFIPALAVDTEGPSWRNLPIPAVDPDDPAAGLLASLAAAPPAHLLAALEGAVPSPHVSFQRARAHLELGDWQSAAEVIAAEIIGAGGISDGGISAGGEDWRIWWWEGILDLVAGDGNEACVAFEKVVAELPGELAPLLALSTAEETVSDDAAAAARYDLVSVTDPGYATAAFGLARIRVKSGDRHGAAAALQRVPAKSSAYQAAQALRCRVLSEVNGAGAPTIDDLVSASGALDRISGDPFLRAGLSRQVLMAALMLHRNDPTAGVGVKVAGVTFDEQSLRLGVERACRALAKLSPADAERVALVDEANAYRPKTLL